MEEVTTQAGLAHGAAEKREIYAYRRGSIGFTRFATADSMWKLLKKFNAKDATKPAHGRRAIWASASRSPEDRKKGKQFATYKKVMIDV